MSFETACGSARWLGRDNMTAPVVRLHPFPIDWLTARCGGVCHIEPYTRQGLKELRAVPSIVCNDMETALDAWEWAFGADDAEMARFDIDAPPEAIRGYFEKQAIFAATRKVVAWERERRVHAGRHAHDRARSDLLGRRGIQGAFAS
jgi:hypothetical protein